MAEHLGSFLTALDCSVQDDTFVKLSLGTYRGREAGLRKVFIKPVALAKGDHLCFVYRHDTKDVTKNLPRREALALIRTFLGTSFLTANLFTTKNDIELRFGDGQRTRLRFAKPTHATPPSKQHNRPKKRAIASAGRPYLALLGVTYANGSIKKGMEAKYKQINRFIETIDPLLRSSSLMKADTISVLDMGSGKGYLTFALYDHLSNTLKKHARITGVEARQDLADVCNKVAQQVGFTDLRFVCDTIQSFSPGRTDVLIALHACDTATDQALFKAITSQAGLILCAPCCHKELRPQMHCAVPGLDKVLRSGILLERQAELVTDGLRALLLETFGYKTSVFEFIATEHTSKNIMIAAVKTPKPPDRKALLAQLEALKNAFGIRTQSLEALLMANAARTGAG